MEGQIDKVEMKKRLIKQREVLSEQIEEEKQKVEPSLMANPDRADLALDYAYRDRRLSLLEKLESQHTDVVKALDKIKEGTYGLCENCGNAILPERLEALPYATLCINCQRKENTR
jgi:DnaK suppressor protein